MSLTSNPVVQATLSLIAGNVLGSSVDTLVTTLDERLKLSGYIGESHLVDSSLSLLMRVGILGLGTHFITNAFPWLAEDTTSFSLWIVGIVVTSGTLIKKLRDFNGALWLPVPPLVPDVKPLSVSPSRS
jgi:hypothetical protein